MEKLKEILKYVIKLQGGKIYTKLRLVKLIYILDREYFKKYGKNLTGVNYKNYYYGPFSHQIEEALEELEKEGSIKIEKMQDIFENKEFYVITLNSHNFSLTEKERTDIKEILNPYFQKSLEEILDIVYESPEFLKTPFGEVIEFQSEKGPVPTSSK